MDRLVILFCYLESFWSSFGGQHGIAVFAEILGCRIADTIFIFGKKNGFCPSNRLLALFCILNLDFCPNGWKIDLESSTYVRFAMDKNLTPALLHDAEHYGEPKSSTLALLLSREEGLKDMGSGLCAHAATVVTYRNHDIFSRLGLISKRVTGV